MLAKCGRGQGFIQDNSLRGGNECMKISDHTHFYRQYRLGPEEVVHGRNVIAFFVGVAIRLL